MTARLTLLTSVLWHSIGPGSENSTTIMKTYIRYSAVLILGFVCGAPLYASAISISIQSPNSVAVEKTFLVDVMLNAEGDEINALSGELYIPSEYFSIEAVYERDSIVTLWVERPGQTSPSTVTWSGIVPGGYSGTLDPNYDDLQIGRLFSIALRARVEGVAALELSKLVVLAHDGIGRELPVTAVSRTISIAGSAPPGGDTHLFVDSDREPPELFTPIISRDRNIFGGEWFVAFTTQDKGSGIRAYSIFESRASRDTIGELDYVTATSPYQLTDQSRTRYIYIRALDYAGNERVVVFPPEKEQSPFYQLFVLFGIIMVAALLLFTWKRTRRFRNAS